MSTVAKLLLFLTLALLSIPGLRAAENDEPEEAKRKLSPELQRVLDKVDEANAELENVRARVLYTREIPLLDESEKSRGRLTFKRPDKIVLRLGEPRNESVHSNGEVWWVADHDAEQVEIYRVATDEGASREAAFLDFGYGRGSDALLKDYNVDIAEKKIEETDEGEATTYRLKFTPRPREERPPRYAAIEVVVSDQRWLPHELVLHESEGEIIHTYQLGNIRTNAELDEEIFEYEPPGDYTVLRPQEM
jgi:outer membrane lipoprotein-sorting protein